MKLLLCIFLVLSSCSDRKIKNKNEIQQSKLLGITCLMVTQEGEDEIYKIKEDSLFSFNRNFKLTKDEYEFLKKIPKEVLNENQNIGCGVCVDGMDYKFIFNFENNSSTIWTIQSGSKLDISVEDYLNFLIKKYKEVLNE